MLQVPFTAFFKKECVKWSDVSFTMKVNLTSEVILLTFSPAVKVHQMYGCGDRNSVLEGHAKSIPSSMQKAQNEKYIRICYQHSVLQTSGSRICYSCVTLLVIKYFLGTL
jgi:hypothetical protein